MRAVYRKQQLPDPQKEGETYVNYELRRDAEFCCDDFKNYCKKSIGWSYERGRFVVVDQISYEGHSVLSISFCPFCGERIEYQDEEAPLKKRKTK